MALITCGLPGAGYHGGAVTCWVVLKAMLARGHRVTVLSLFDNSDANPYLDSRKAQAEAISKSGAGVEFIDYNHRRLTKKNAIGSLGLEKFFPWARLRPKVQSRLADINPEAVFCYHFDALSAVYNISPAPLIAGVGDLWHLPGYFRWKLKKPSVSKYFLELPYRLMMFKLAKKFMLRMLSPCVKRGAFAAHYAAWLRQQKGLSDTLYFRTPVLDPLGDKWQESRKQYTISNKKPIILMIGDVSGTATKWGLRTLEKETLPALEKKYGPAGFEIHIVGGGTADATLKRLMQHPGIKVKGRIVPPDAEFLNADLLLAPMPVNLGIRVKIITAFSYGCCVVAHRASASGIPELMHGDNSLIAENTSGLAAGVIRLWEDESLRRHLSINARRTFEEYFSESVAAVRIVKEIENTVKSIRG